MHHPMHLPTKCTIHLHAMNLSTNQSCSQTIFLEQDYLRLQCTFHLHIYAMHTLQCDTYMLDLSFSTYYDVAKLQIVCGEQIQPHCLGNIQEYCSSLTSAVVLPR